MENEVKQFVEQYIDLIDSNKFTELYFESLPKFRFGESRGELTMLLHAAGIFPEQFMNELPNDFYAGAPLEEILTIPKNIIAFNDYCFYGSGIEVFVIPSHIKKLGFQCFSECDNLVRIEIPGSIKTIPNKCFSYNPKLQTVIIQEGVTTIEEGAFNYNASLTYMRLPASIEHIGDAFYGSNEINFYVKKGSYAEEFCMHEDFNYTHY